MQRGPQHHKDMPDKVRPLGVLHKWNHAKRIDNTSAHDPSQKRLVISEPARNEHDSAPSDDEVQRIVYRSEPARAEHTYDGDPRYNKCPLHTEQHYSKHISPVHKVQWSKCSAYQQIYRGIVKSSPSSLFLPYLILKLLSIYNSIYNLFCYL